MGYRRNLAAWEIAGQAREIVLADPADQPTNVVFMGMGEPLLNWPAVDVTLTQLNHPEGFGIGARHITVSTVGIIPAMRALAARPEQFRVAISLHSPDRERRRTIMPIEKKYDLEAVLEAAKVFSRRITFEYVMIAGVNDSDEDVDALTTLARRLGRHGQSAAAPSRRGPGAHTDTPRPDQRVCRTPQVPGGRSRGPAQSGSGYRCRLRPTPWEGGAETAGRP